MGEKLVVKSMLFKSIAVALDIDYFAMMEESVQDGRGDDGISEQFLPVEKALVGGKDRRAFFIPIGDELKEEVSFLAVHREVADLIDNHQRGV